jgi:hypothetical protein
MFNQVDIGVNRVHLLPCLEPESEVLKAATHIDTPAARLMPTCLWSFGGYPANRGQESSR